MKRSKAGWLMVLLAGSAALLGACGKSGVTCPGVGVSPGPHHTVSWDGCSDQQSRKIQCDAAPGTRPAYNCTCLQGGVPGRKFQTFEVSAIVPNSPAGHAIANQQCGWSLASP